MNTCVSLRLGIFEMSSEVSLQSIAAKKIQRKISQKANYMFGVGFYLTALQALWPQLENMKTIGTSWGGYPEESNITLDNSICK